MEYKVTVIIPAYNAEGYIKKTIDSILEQTFTEIKITIINDGSTDGTSKIVNEYKLIDPRIFLFEKENSGVASTRNFGLSLIDTDYFCFVDSDDCLDKNYINDMFYLATIEGSDIVICDYNVVREGNVTRVDSYVQGESGNYIKSMLAHGMWGVVWNKMFKTKFIIDNGVSFIDGFNFWEDLFFCVNAFSMNPTISHTREPLYNYIIRESSLLNSDNNEGKVESKIKVVEEI